MLLLFVLFLFISPADVHTAPYYSFFYPQIPQPPDPLGFLYLQSPFLYIFWLTGLAAFCGGVYATLGLAASALLRHPLAALAVPIGVFALGDYFTTRSLKLALLGPWKSSLLPYTNQGAPWQIVAQYALLLLTCLICFLIFARRGRLLGDR